MRIKLFFRYAFSLPSYTDFVYQAFALTLSDTIFGDKVYFKTLPQQSSVETEAATNVSPYSALVAAAIQYGDDTIIKKDLNGEPKSNP